MKNQTWWYAKKNNKWVAAGIIPRAKELISYEDCLHIINRIYGPNQILYNEPNLKNTVAHWFTFNQHCTNEFYLCTTTQDLSNTGIHRDIKRYQNSMI